MSGDADMKDIKDEKDDAETRKQKREAIKTKIFDFFKRRSEERR